MQVLLHCPDIEMVPAYPNFVSVSDTLLGIFLIDTWSSQHNYQTGMLHKANTTEETDIKIMLSECSKFCL